MTHPYHPAGGSTPPPDGSVAARARALPPPPAGAQVATPPPPGAVPMVQEGFDTRATTHRPTTASVPPPGKGGKVAAIVGGTMALLALVAVAAVGIHLYMKRDRAMDAVVRVVTPHGSGSGFFVKGPDDHAYVATAFHVVAGGERVLVERNVTVDRETYYVEAFPETEVVAYDAEADLAILRVKNLRGRVDTLDLAEQPMANEPVRSYGFPGSNITRRTGLVAKDGKLLSLVKFPVYDLRNKRIVRDNAIEGLLVSTDIEDGFSGGPTINDDGDVVGVNVTKDMAHRGQNGVVHVKLLKTLIDKVRPSAEQTEPSSEDVEKLLARLQREYLLLPVSQRADIREHDFMSTSELPRLRTLIDEIRRHERDSFRLPGAPLSGRAAFGVWAAQLPGKPLETYMAEDVQKAIAKCERTSERLMGLFGNIADDEKKEAEKAALEACDELALRPMSWDLLAATLQWTGKERGYNVSKIERVDDEANIYRAMVKVSGLDNLLPLWLTTEYGALRVKLFDQDGKLYGVKNAADPQPSELAGEWEMRQPRAPVPGLADAERERVETLSVSVSGRDVTIKHVVDEKRFAADRKVFSCNASRDVETGLVQSFAGKLDKGVVVATPKSEARRTGRDAGYCLSDYSPDAVAVLKLIDKKLTMYRTDGSGFVQAIELTRKKDEPKDEKKDEKP